VKVGGRYVNFTAPDLEGNYHKVSEEIKGKVALIDFWASWCGPCRRHSRSLIPVYEKYKDRGFTIVGVARERDAEAMRKAIGRDKYPWLNLIELNDRIKLWNQYGIRGGGGTFLVDRNGIILAVDPTAEEVEAILREVL
ncbi:MAG: TlpA disulfide reductase family protein, partial [Prevotella sp.]|nr:TlpA disulfide reductase family protein [Prevotella sp.]